MQQRLSAPKLKPAFRGSHEDVHLAWVSWLALFPGLGLCALPTAPHWCQGLTPMLPGAEGLPIAQLVSPHGVWDSLQTPGADSPLSRAPLFKSQPLSHKAQVLH